MDILHALLQVFQIRLERRKSRFQLSNQVAIGSVHIHSRINHKHDQYVE